VIIKHTILFLNERVVYSFWVEMLLDSRGYFLIQEVLELSIDLFLGIIHTVMKTQHQNPDFLST